MGQKAKSASLYTNRKDRRRVVIEYYIKGNDQAVADITGISRQTINTWRLHSDWWDELLGEVRHEIDDQILGQNLQIAIKSGEGVLDSLENGDEKLVWDKEKKEHVIKRMKPSAYHSMLVSGISQDKARVQLNLPTSITAKAEDYQALAKQFKELSETWGEKQLDVVSVQEKSEEIEQL